MSVIISDFEIFPDSPNSSGTDEGGANASERESSEIRPIDVEQIVERDRRRRLRLRAH